MTVAESRLRPCLLRHAVLLSMTTLLVGGSYGCAGSGGSQESTSPPPAVTQQQSKTLPPEAVDSGRVEPAPEPSPQEPTAPATNSTAQAESPAPVEPAAEPAPEPTPEQLAEIRRLNLESFDVIWKTVQERHYDPNLNGIDWQAAREQYRPLVEQATSVEEARELMQKMIDALGDSHMAVVPAAAYKAFAGDEGGEEGARDGDSGLSVRLVDRDDATVLVTAVKPGSGAEAAGVRPGWQVVRVGDSNVQPLVEELVRALDARGHGKPETYASFAVQKRLTGPSGGSVPVTFLNAQGVKATLDIPLQAAPGEITQLGALPPMRVDFTSHRVHLNGAELGYFGFNAFLDPPRVMRAFGEAMADFTNPEHPVDGVVIDVRGNIGGVIMMCSGIAGYFVDQQGLKLGTLQTRDGELNLVIFPRPQTYDGPLAILTDACSVSAAELLSGGLQSLGRARVFGNPTAGEALPALVQRLPNGDGFLFAFADYTTADGGRLEGEGVLPDEPVPYDRATLLSGQDPMLSAAATWIAQQAQPAEEARPAQPDAPTTTPADPIGP